MARAICGENGYFCFKLTEEDVAASTIYVKFLDEVRASCVELYNVVVDVDGIDVIYSNNISDLVKIKKLLLDNNGELYLINVAEKLERLFTLNNLQKVINIYATEEEFLFDIGSDDIVNDSTVLNSNFSTIEDSNSRTVLMDGSLVGYEQKEEIQAVFNDAVSSGKKMIQLDLSKTVFIDSSAMSMLVAMVKEAREEGVSITFINANEVIKDLFELTGFDSFITNS